MAFKPQKRGIRIRDFPVVLQGKFHETREFIKIFSLKYESQSELDVLLRSFLMNPQTLFIQKLFNWNYTSLRACSKLPEGIKYYGFTYYPRHKDFKDPPCIPSKLFLVKRIKSMKGRNPLERRILEQLNLDGDKKYYGHINIVKNIPPINCLLWKVKHLVDIKPITWKGELPEGEDVSGTYLRDTGELKISPMLKVSEERLKFSEAKNDEKSKLTLKYLKEYLKSQWEKRGEYIV